MRLIDLKGVGQNRLDSLHAAGIDSLRDLLFTSPIRYKNLGDAKTVDQAQAGESAALRVRRVGAPKLARYGGRSRVTCLFEDDTGEVTACWFNQPWMKEQLMKRSDYLLFGKLERYGGKWQLMNPSLETELRIIPVYRPIEGVPPKVQEALTKQALDEAEAECPETLPESLLAEYGLTPLPGALRMLHQPATMDEAVAGQRRLMFDQLLMYQAAVRMMKGARQQGYAMVMEDGAADDYWASLPFQPTGAQKRTLLEILRDMRADTAMARMVQGDVGSGTTAIACGAMELCARAGYQAALMAPTEILARQHFESLKHTLGTRGIACGLLLGGMKARERREALEAIRTGAWQAVVGTHALIGDSVEYENLGLCVTDEQHRFGVGQRTRLIGKGRQQGRAPDLLVMSATPIPRSLALILFGDLDVSVVDELPPGRQPVRTRLVPESKREGMYTFLRAQLAAGRQAYIVCPLVEEDEANEQKKAVESHCAELRKGPLKGYAIGLTHGRQSSEEKARTLEDFAKGSIAVLVATTVIEVGVNVPNATVMIVENAERFGLAQLHQLRGRVGRGAEQSWCFLLAKENERLLALTQTNDGFEIAQKDLELRGPGELLGTRQHGIDLLPGGTSLLGDTALMHGAAECALRLENDPSLADALAQVRRSAERYLSRALEDVSVS